MESEQAEQRARNRIGSVLKGKYRLDGVIGVGGMAVVYKATHRNQAEFAIKMLHPELSLNDNIRGRFLREGYAANSVKHPGVVLVVDDDIAEDGAAFLVMEILHGLTADDAWTALGGRIPLDAACAVAVELLDVLAAAHDRGILHRDIKPANVFITRDGSVKVLDFGIARVKDSMGGGSHATGTGMLLGTPAFMAPEQVVGKPSEVDARADIWATGASIFNLVSGEMVHEAETGPQLMVKLATQPPRALNDVLPAAPPAVASVVDRALSFDKNSRWPTAGAMRDALRAACELSFGAFVPRSILAKLVVAAKPPGAQSAAAGSAATGTPRPAFTPPGGLGASASGAKATPGVRVATPASPLATSTSSQVYQGEGIPMHGARKGVIGLVIGVTALAIVGTAVVVLRRPAPSSAPAVTQPGPSNLDAKPNNGLVRNGPAASATAAPEPVTTLAPEPAHEPSGEQNKPTPGLGPGSTRTTPTQGARAEGAVTTKRAGAPSTRNAAAHDAGSSGAGVSKANCNPPYTLDSNGEKRFKPECFQ
jgi:serine/threonine-protein kinase